MKMAMTTSMDAWLKTTVIKATPESFGYDTALWTCDILRELLFKCYHTQVVGATVDHHLKQMKLSYLKPSHVPSEQYPTAVARFVNIEFTKNQRFAEKINADIEFGDESAVALRDNAGTICGACGATPQVQVTGKHRRFNTLSVVTANGKFNFHVTKKKAIKSAEYNDLILIWICF
jgi:hypothetical protein